MAVVSTNLSTVIGYYAHSPSLKSETNRSPLYGRVENYQDNSELHNLKMDSDWQLATKNNYSSPTNIRRLVIGTDRILINFFKPFIRNGEPSKEGCWKVVAYKQSENFDNILNEYIQYIVKTLKSPGMANNDKSVRITGKVLGCLDHPWVMSNIEEIYIDAKFIITDTCREKIGNKGFLDLLSSFSSTLKQMKDETNLLDIVMNNPGDIGRFKRLRVIALVNNVSSIIKSGVYKTGDRVGPGEKLWLKSMEDRGVRVTAIQLYYNRDNANSTSFSVRNYYKFDAEVLSNFAETLKRDVEQKLKDAAIERYKSRFEGETKDKSSQHENELEKAIKSIDKQYGLDIASIVVSISIARAGEARKKLIDSFSESARIRYAIN